MYVVNEDVERREVMIHYFFIDESKRAGRLNNPSPSSAILFVILIFDRSFTKVEISHLQHNINITSIRLECHRRSMR